MRRRETARPVPPAADPLRSCRCRGCSCSATRSRPASDSGSSVSAARATASCRLWNKAARSAAGCCARARSTWAASSFVQDALVRRLGIALGCSRSTQFQPNVVVLLTGAWDLLDRKINGQYYSPGTRHVRPLLPRGARPRHAAARLDRARGRGAHHTVLLAPRAGGPDRAQLARVRAVACRPDQRPLSRLRHPLPGAVHADRPQRLRLAGREVSRSTSATCASATTACTSRRTAPTWSRRGSCRSSASCSRGTARPRYRPRPTTRASCRAV